MAENTNEQPEQLEDLLSRLVKVNEEIISVTSKLVEHVSTNRDHVHELYSLLARVCDRLGVELED